MRALYLVRSDLFWSVPMTVASPPSEVTPKMSSREVWPTFSHGAAGASRLAGSAVPVGAVR